MSKEYEGQDPATIAAQAEKDLNSYRAKTGHEETTQGASISTVESGVDATVQNKFPGASVQYGSAASGAGGNRDIPVEEGGDVDARGRLSKARHFEGEGGPETKAAQNAEMNPGSDSVRENVRPSGGDQKVHD